MSAVYPPESSQDTAKGTLIQGYAMLNLLNYNIVILTSKQYFSWNRGSGTDWTESEDKSSVYKTSPNWTIKTL